MTDHKTDPSYQQNSLLDSIREVRKRYDQLERGKTATLRRCRTADEVALEGAYWRIGERLAHENRHLPHVVVHFQLAPHSRQVKFSFGRYLRRGLGDTDGAALRFRRLLDCRDREELDHRLRGILKLASADKTPVDWGVLGRDILWFFAESAATRRRWAQDFYAPVREASTGASAPSPVTEPNA